MHDALVESLVYSVDPHWGLMETKKRCRGYRRRILDLSQSVSALHIGGAFSAVEMVDCVYNVLMDARGTFILSKGHAAILQYVVLESKGVLPPGYLEGYCTSNGSLGVHPDRKTPGITCSTGSLGHGLAMALGIALADRKSTVYVLVSDGEIQEGSTWEAVLLASSLGVDNLVLLVDNNDFQSFGRTSQTHPSLYPIAAKFKAFGWDSLEIIDGHNSVAIADAVYQSRAGKPFALVCRTVKGRGVSFMENVPMWHYRSPNRAEYAAAVGEMEAAA